MTVERLEARYYPGYVDEHARFDAMIRARLRPGMAVLDAGAGRGLMYPYDHRDVAARMVGVDVDPAVIENPNVDEALVASLSSMPVPDETFDLVFSKYVVEHLDDPIAVFRELRRVMKTGAHLLLHTPNRHHYVALAARLTTTRFHARFNESRGRPAKDTFPTRYRANTRTAIERLAMATGFKVVSLERIETKPDYLTFSPIAYRAGVGYERLVNRWPALEGIRVQILADLEAV